MDNKTWIFPLVFFVCALWKTAASHGCDSCYSFHGEKILNWEQSRTNCLNDGGDLVSMETEDEWEFIKDEIQTRNTDPDGVDEWWIGLRIPESDYLRKNQPFTWLSNASLTIDHWQTDKPSFHNYSPEEFYVVIAQNWKGIGSFSNIRADIKRGYICEYKSGCKKDHVRRPGCSIETTTAPPTTTPTRASTPVPTTLDTISLNECYRKLLFIKCGTPVPITARTQPTSSFSAIDFIRANERPRAQTDCSFPLAPIIVIIVLLVAVIALCIALITLMLKLKKEQHRHGGLLNIHRPRGGSVTLETFNPRRSINSNGLSDHTPNNNNKNNNSSGVSNDTYEAVNDACPAPVTAVQNEVTYAYLTPPEEALEAQSAASDDCTEDSKHSTTNDSSYASLWEKTREAREIVPSAGSSVTGDNDYLTETATQKYNLED